MNDQNATRAAGSSAPACWRRPIGQPQTVGELRAMLWPFDGATKLAVRNAPLATLHDLGVNREGFVEIEIPDIHPANSAICINEELK